MVVVLGTIELGKRWKSMHLHVVGFYADAIFSEGVLEIFNIILNVCVLWFIISMQKMETTDLPAQVCVCVCVCWGKQQEVSTITALTQ